MIIGLSASLAFLIAQQNTVAQEHDAALQDRAAYADKKFECYGSARTNNSTVNNAGLSSCGGELAVETLQFKSLYDIYHTYCNQGFGVAIYGCAYPQIRTVYVCSPGTTLYDRRNTYVSYYYIRYQYISYACNDVDPKNTIRHELLHLVYADLSNEDQARVYTKLSSYEPMYASQLSGYSSYDRDDELFVRVGADGRHVDDIELVDLYSQVSATYSAQKYDYYGSLASTSDKYVKKYDDLSNKYSALLVIVIILLIINACFLIYLVSAMRNMNTKNMRKRREDVVKEAHRNYVESSNRKESSDYYNTDDAELDSLKRQIDEMGHEPKRNMKKEFDEFKRKYGIIDVDEKGHKSKIKGDTNSEVNECAACGAKLKEDEKYCHDCGTWCGI